MAGSHEAYKNDLKEFISEIKTSFIGFKKGNNYKNYPSTKYATFGLIMDVIIGKQMGYPVPDFEKLLSENGFNTDIVLNSDSKNNEYLIKLSYPMNNNFDLQEENLFMKKEGKNLEKFNEIILPMDNYKTLHQPKLERYSFGTELFKSPICIEYFQQFSKNKSGLINSSHNPKPLFSIHPNNIVYNRSNNISNSIGSGTIPNRLEYHNSYLYNNGSHLNHNLYQIAPL